MLLTTHGAEISMIPNSNSQRPCDGLVGEFWPAHEDQSSRTSFPGQPGTAKGVMGGNGVVGIGKNALETLEDLDAFSGLANCRQGGRARNLRMGAARADLVAEWHVRWMARTWSTRGCQSSPNCHLSFGFLACALATLGVVTRRWDHPLQHVI